LHIIGQSKKNERLPGMTPNKMMLDVCVSSKKQKDEKDFKKTLNFR
jgi:hypothetical protein